VLIVKIGCYQSPEVLEFFPEVPGSGPEPRGSGFFLEVPGMGTTSLLIESVMSYASHLLVTPVLCTPR
jgi:hypothetical protein